jgi:serine/threonine-protein kinase SRPK3
VNRLENSQSTCGYAEDHRQHTFERISE